MTTEAEIEAALKAFEDWICLDGHEHSMQCLAMRAALEAAAAVREGGSTGRLPSTTERIEDA